MQELNLNNIDITKSHLQASNLLQEQRSKNLNKNEIPYQQQQNQILQSNKFWKTQFKIGQKRTTQTFNISNLQNLDPQQISDIQHITPIIRNFIESEVNIEHFESQKLDYQSFFKLFQAYKTAVMYYTQGQALKQQESQSLYIKFKKLKEINDGTTLIKKQHTQRKEQLKSQIKKLQFQIEQLKQQQENIGNFKCQYCTKQFPTVKLLTTHITKNHQDIVEEAVNLRKEQLKYAHPEVQKEKIQYEEQNIKQLQNLEKNIEEMPQDLNKEQIIIDKITGYLKQNMNAKIQQQLKIVNEQREKEAQLNEKLYYDKQKQLQLLQQKIDGFKQVSEDLSKQQHNLVDLQYEQNKIIEEMAQQQEKIKKDKEIQKQHQEIETHQQILKQLEQDRRFREEVLFQGNSQVLDNKKSWFFDSGLRIQKKTEENLAKSGFFDFINPKKPKQYVQEVNESEYSKTQSKDYTQEFDQSQTVTSQNLPLDEDILSEQFEQEKEQMIINQFREEIEDQEKQIYLQQCVGDLESDRDSQDQINPNEFQPDVLVPIDEVQQKQNKEEKYKRIINQKQQELQQKMNYLEYQQLQSKISQLKLELDNVQNNLAEQSLYKDKKSVQREQYEKQKTDLKQKIKAVTQKLEEIQMAENIQNRNVAEPQEQIIKEINLDLKNNTEKIQEQEDNFIKNYLQEDLKDSKINDLHYEQLDELLTKIKTNKGNKME